MFHPSCRRVVPPAVDRRIVGLLLLGVAVLVLATGLGLGAPSPADAKARLVACNDNVDNDGDGKFDLTDPGCANNNRDNDEADLATVPRCSDGIDNDNDGKIDFAGKVNPAPAPPTPADPGCATAGNGNEMPDPAPVPQCADGIDNDGDGGIDVIGTATNPGDVQCVGGADDLEAQNACSDGQDNDGDGKKDWPADPGCSSPNNAGEKDPPQCNDGIDNDRDGKLDTDTNIPGQTADPGCSSPADDDETDPLPEPTPAVARCADGKDNDADGKIDYPADPGCTSASDDDETDPPPGLPLVQPPCADGKDNDADGKIDFPKDPGCTSAADDDETDVAVGSSDTGPQVLTPFPVVRLRGRVFPSSVLITLLTVSAPQGSRVTTYCKGASCKRKRVAMVAGKRIVRVRKFERRLRAGTVLRVYVTKTGFVGKYTRFRVMKGRPPVRTDRCASKPGSQPRNCPTS